MGIVSEQWGKYISFVGHLLILAWACGWHLYLIFFLRRLYDLFLCFNPRLYPFPIDSAHTTILPHVRIRCTHNQGSFCGLLAGPQIVKLFQSGGDFKKSLGRECFYSAGVLSGGLYLGSCPLSNLGILILTKQLNAVSLIGMPRRFVAGWFCAQACQSAISSAVKRFRQYRWKSNLKFCRIAFCDADGERWIRRGLVVACRPDLSRLK